MRTDILCLKSQKRSKYLAALFLRRTPISGAGSGAFGGSRPQARPGISRRVFTRKRCDDPRKDSLEVRPKHLHFDERTELRLVRLLSTFLQRSLSRLSVGDRRQGRCNDPYKNSMEVRSPREGSRPAAKREDDEVVPNGPHGLWQVA